MTTKMVTCPTCGRAFDREKAEDSYRIRLTGKPPEACCQAFATDGHKVVGMFVTEP